MILTAIIIDDSALQQMATRKLVKNSPNLQLIGAFSDPKIGLEAVNFLKPDVLILDVEMPVINGFQLLDQLDCDCQVIMNSTRAEFAANAFEYDAVKDFLVKPMNGPRFEKTVEKVTKNQYTKKMGPAVAAPVESLLQAS